MRALAWLGLLFASPAWAVLTSGIATESTLLAFKAETDANLQAILGQLDTPSSGLATETTLASFKSVNHQDLLDVEALITTSNSTLASIDTKTPALVSGRVPVDGSGVTQPISAVSLPLPTGAATSANQATGNASLASIDGKLNSLGQKTAAGSVPVVLPVSQDVRDDALVTGPLTGNGGTIEIDTEGRAAVMVSLTSGISALVVPQGTMDNVTWHSIPAYPVNAGDAVTILSANVPYYVPVAGWLKFRLISAFWSAGTSTVTMTASSMMPRSPVHGVVRATQPTPMANTVQAFMSLNKYGQLQTANPVDVAMEWGKVFRVTTDYISTGVAAETPLMLLRNPGGSGVSVKIVSITFHTPVTGSVEYRTYSSPTITSVGTALTPVGGRQTGQAAPVGLMYKLPSASSFGTVSSACHIQNTTTPFKDSGEYGRWLDPGNDMLITATKSGAGVLTSVTIDYMEQP